VQAVMGVVEAHFGLVQHQSLDLVRHELGSKENHDDIQGILLNQTALAPQAS
jgi:hypothetical protein